MKNFLMTCFLVGFGLVSQAQDDLLGELDKNTKPTKTYTTATFKSTRVINGHSIETVSAKHLDFRIAHRFGALNSGYQELFGLDQSKVRISFEYGLADNLMVGVGRSSYQKTYDYFVKYKVIRQSSGETKRQKGMPISVAIFVNAATNTLATSPDMRFYNNLERQTYCAQLLIARKFSDNVSFQISPTILHRNKTEIAGDKNTLFSMGFGGRAKISKRTSLNAEYWLTPNLNAAYTNCLSLGFDIETGGHVFQLHFTNSRGMVENQFIGQTVGKWGGGDIFYGFNISRTFSFDKNTKK